MLLESMSEPANTGHAPREFGCVQKEVHQDKRYHRTERADGCFFRCFGHPADVDAPQVVGDTSTVEVTIA